MLHVYTMDQVHAFGRAARANADEDLLEAATAFRVAQTPDRSWKKYVGHLMRRNSHTKKASGGVMTPAQAAELKSMARRKGR